MQECPSCALEVDHTLDVCPYCAYEFPRQTRSRTVMAWVMALLLIWPLLELIKLIF